MDKQRIEELRRLAEAATLEVRDCHTCEEWIRTMGRGPESSRCLRCPSVQRRPNWTRAQYRPPCAAEVLEMIDYIELLEAERSSMMDHHLTEVNHPALYRIADMEAVMEAARELAEAEKGITWQSPDTRSGNAFYAATIKTRQALSNYDALDQKGQDNEQANIPSR